MTSYGGILFLSQLVKVMVSFCPPPPQKKKKKKKKNQKNTAHIPTRKAMPQHI